MWDLWNTNINGNMEDVPVVTAPGQNKLLHYLSLTNNFMITNLVKCTENLDLSSKNPTMANYFTIYL